MSTRRPQEAKIITRRPKMSPRRPQEAKNEAQEGPRRGQEGPRESKMSPRMGQERTVTKILIFGPPKVPPGTTLQHFWGCALRKN